MIIKTSKNTKYEAVWFGETLDHKLIAGEIFSPIDGILLSEIAGEFEPLNYIDRYDESEGNKRFLIEPMLRGIYWTDRGTIRLDFWGKQE